MMLKELPDFVAVVAVLVALAVGVSTGCGNGQEAWSAVMLDRGYDGPAQADWQPHRAQLLVPKMKTVVKPPDGFYGSFHPPAPLSPVEQIVERWEGEGRLAQETAVAVAYWESKWKPTAANPTCCASGLFQITQGTWFRNCGRETWPTRLEVAANIDCAWTIWSRDNRSWGQWSVYNEAVEAGSQVKVCPSDPFCRMTGGHAWAREVAERAVG